MFRPDDSHLELLFEFGLGRGDGGPWKRRLGEAAENNEQMMARQVLWAIDHGFDGRVRLLIRHGVDVSCPLADGRTPAEHAIAAGRLDLLADLRAAGATIPAVTDAEQLIGLLLAGDRAASDAFVRNHPDVLPTLLRSSPALVRQARTAQSVTTIVRAGFDVNSRHGGPTALHEAAFNGDVPLITALLAAGADPSLLDHEHRSTALGWAQYGNQPAAVEVLTAVT
jgi:ankyrin repeat protein